MQAAYNNLTCGGDPGDAVSKEISNSLTLAFARQLVAGLLFPERRRLNPGVDLGFRFLIRVVSEMIAFARFVMRDNGLAIHINTQQVTQVRQTSEGEPAIYIVGRETPMVVEGTLEGAIHKLEAAAAGLKVVEPSFEPIVETPVVAVQPSKLGVVAVESEAAFEPSPEPEPAIAEAASAKAKLAKTKAVTKAKPAKANTESEPVKPAKVEAKPVKSEAKPVKSEAKPVKSEAKPTKAEAKPTKAPEAPYPAASWFMGNR